jgi:hypothetical protein
MMVLAGGSAWASSAGIFGAAGQDPAMTCNTCHTGGGTPNVTVTGPTNITGRDNPTYTVTISGGAGVRAGFDAYIVGFGAQLRAGSNAVFAMGPEATHNVTPLAMNGGSASFTFQFIPPSIGGTYELYVAGLSANGNGATGGDGAALRRLTITVTGVPGGPIIVNPAAAELTSIAGSTTNVSVLGADDSGEASLTYTWSSTGPGNVTFTPNGTNASKNASAKFTKAGTYKLTAAMRDPAGLTTTSEVTVTVVPTLRFIRLTPETVSVYPGQTVQFAASGRDQFDSAMPDPQPTFDWSVAGGGTVSSSGVFKAQSAPGGPFVVFASTSTAVGAASVTIVASGTPLPQPQTPGPSNPGPNTPSSTPDPTDPTDPSEGNPPATGGCSATGGAELWTLPLLALLGVSRGRRRPVS